MDTANSKQSDLDKRYIRMASIWSENPYRQLYIGRNLFL